jgi:hypothetical protein
MCRGADATQKRQRFAVTAGKDMLAVVNPLSGRGIPKRSRAPAEPRSRLEDMDTDASLGQRCRRRKPGKAGTDHNSRAQSLRRCHSVSAARH